MAISKNTIMRCGYCNYPMPAYELEKDGGCGQCSSRKFKIAFSVTDEEIVNLKERGYTFDSNWTDKPWVTDAA